MWIEYGEYYRFTYAVNDVFKFCKGKSSYRTRNLEFKDAEMTEDDEKYFIALLKRAGQEIFNRISKLGEGITNPYQYQPTDDVSTSTVDESEGLVYTLSFDDDWETDLLGKFDLKLMDCIVSHVLKQWFETQGMFDVAAEMGYENNISDLLSLTIYRNTPVRKTYNSGFN